MNFEPKRREEPSELPDEHMSTDVPPYVEPVPGNSEEQTAALPAETGLTEAPAAADLGQLALTRVVDADTLHPTKRMGRPPKLTPELLELALERYASSAATVNEIAEDLGVSPATISRAAAAAGLDARHGGARKGVSRALEVRRQMSETQKGRTFSETHRRRLSAGAKRRWQNVRNAF